MTGLAHVLSPEGGWLGFEAFDPAAVDAVKALLDANICSDDATESGYHQAQTENQVGPALVEQPGPVDDDLSGGVAVADSSHRSLAIAEPGMSR